MANGSRVYYRIRGAGPAIALIHGGSAHGGWWTEVSKRLAPEFTVIVPDLAGHGHSGHREAYGPEIWACDVREAVRSAGATRVFVVGHSMGGAVGIWLAAIDPELVAGLILIDTSLPSGDTGRLDAWRRPHRLYPTREEILSRFRLLPPGTAAKESVTARLAEQSIVHTPDGWTWRFDPATRGVIGQASLHEALARVKCPVGYITGEYSAVFDEATITTLEELLGRQVQLEVVADAFHHVPLDAPDECAELIKGFVSRWSVEE